MRERPRRVCLFAGFDADGFVDDTVVAYVAELSRFADVYYLADSDLAPGELERLAPYTRGRWAVRHGRYDFGSYAMLARDLVGWDVIEGYDELLLVNDSCYLVQPFDRVFERMDARAVDWWGLQATYDEFTTEACRRAGGGPLPLDALQERLRVLDLWRYHDFMHVGSYFLAYRSRVIADPEFRRRLDTVATQRAKSGVVLKYEIGLSRLLVLAGYRLDTFVDGVLPFHPVYRDSAFDLLDDGFPLLKRQLLAENPFAAPDLHRWRRRVRAAVPDADVDTMERNLLRVSPPWELERSLAVRSRPDGSVNTDGPHVPATPEELEEEDAWTPTYDHWWAFAVDPLTHRLEGSARAVFEAVRWDPTIRKIVMTDGERQDLRGFNVLVVPVDGPSAPYYLMRCGNVFVVDSPRTDVPYPLSAQRHHFLNVRRGTSLEAFGLAAPVPDTPEGQHLREVLGHDNAITYAVVASAWRDRHAVRAPFDPVPDERIWVTGPPRTDLVLAESSALPDDLREQGDRLRSELAGRRLVLLLPAARPGGAEALPRFAPDDQQWLSAWLRREGAVLGVRPPEDSYVEHLAAVRPLDLSARRYPDVEAVLRETALLVSDYTSELADFPVTGRPVVCYAPDLDDAQRFPGLLHDLAEVVPGPVCRDVAGLRAALERAFRPPTDEERIEYERRRRLLHRHMDGRNVDRLVRAVRRGR